MTRSPRSPSEPSAATEDDIAPMPVGRRDGFRALRHDGFRIYLGGMLVRGTAVWMQLVMIPLLAVRLGATPLELGLITSLLFLPTLFIAALGGVLADRIDRGRILILTGSGSALLSISLWLLIVSDAASLSWVALAAAAFGVLTAVELPVRQAYLTELVPTADVTSAVSLHATAWNTTRFIGPVVAGLIIATIGMAIAFLVAAAAAFLVSLTVLWMERYRHAGRQRTDTSTGILADLREGAAFALREPAIRWPLILVAAVAILGIQAFQTLAPLYGTVELGLDPGAYGLYIGLWGAGGVAAALFVTTFARGDRRPWLVGGTLAMALLLGLIALSGVVPISFLLALGLGFAQIALVQNALISVQAAAPDAMRGRVMGIYVAIFGGASPFGALLAGWLAQLVGVRGAMLAGAIALAVVGLAAWVSLRRLTTTSTAVSPSSSPP